MDIPTDYTTNYFVNTAKTHFLKLFKGDFLNKLAKKSPFPKD